MSDSIALILRCQRVHDSSYDSDTLVAAQAGDPKAISKQERDKLLAHMSHHAVGTRQYVLIEPMSSEQIKGLVERAKKKAKAMKEAEARRRAAEEKKRREAALKRKKKRLEKLEALAKETKS